MKHELLERYARLIVRTGVNVHAGQKVELTIQIDQSELAELIVRECYQAGARRVEVKWQCSAVERLHYQYASAQELGTVLKWEDERGKQQVQDLPVRILIESEDPDALSGLDAEKLSQVRQMRQKVLKKYRDQIDGKHQWVIAAAASPAWAKKVFPHDNEAAAVEKLWNAIFSCVYMDTDRDPVEVWAEHNALMREKATWLNEQRFVRLHYKSANGTDFSVGLIPQAKWEGAADVNHDKNIHYIPNMPTEEVFTSPMKGVCDGTLVSTRPLSWSGQVIDHFSVTYHNGKVVSCKAEQGQELLEKMFHMDDGASMLGEIALVPKESPINRSGLMFFNTLFDENACCHVAAGMGFGEVLPDFPDLTKEQMSEMGLNDSMIHVDYMVGSDDLCITGYRADGSSAPIFINGTWA